jgi:hypothetical protein
MVGSALYEGVAKEPRSVLYAGVALGASAIALGAWGRDIAEIVSPPRVTYMGVQGVTKATGKPTLRPGLTEFEGEARGVGLARAKGAFGSADFRYGYSSETEGLVMDTGKQFVSPEGVAPDKWTLGRSGFDYEMMNLRTGERFAGIGRAMFERSSELEPYTYVGKGWTFNALKTGAPVRSVSAGNVVDIPLSDTATNFFARGASLSEGGSLAQFRGVTLSYDLTKLAVVEPQAGAGGASFFGGGGGGGGGGLALTTSGGGVIAEQGTNAFAGVQSSLFKSFVSTGGAVAATQTQTIAGAMAFEAALVPVTQAGWGIGGVMSALTVAREAVVPRSAGGLSVGGLTTTWEGEETSWRRVLPPAGVGDVRVGERTGVFNNVGVGVDTGFGQMGKSRVGVDTGFGGFTGQLTDTGTITDIAQKQISITGEKTVIETPTRTVTVPDFGVPFVPTPSPPVTPVPIIPPLVPDLGGGGWGFGRGSLGLGKEARYTPSMAAVMLDIHGKKPGVLTGLEIRPLLGKKRKVKRGKEWALI